MNILIKKITTYFKEIDDLNSLWKNLVFSIIISALLAIVDFYDKPSLIIEKIPTKIIVLFFIVLFILAIFFSQKYHLHKQINFCSINQFDVFLLCCEMVIILYTIIIVGFQIMKPYKACIMIILFVFGLFLSAIRIHNHKSKTENKNNTNIDLKELCENSLSPDMPRPILLDEKDIDYDLLNRRWLINQLVNSIKSCQSDQSFVIALEGEWGSGKTTIINIAKKVFYENPSYRVIDDFDPWTYGSQESLLIAMYDSILKCSGLNFNVFSEYKVIKKALATLSKIDSKTNSVFELFSIFESEKDTLKRIKERIKSYCEQQDITIVFFIDNIDRIDADKIIFLFKLIGNVFDLPRIIYVLSYDEKRLHRILVDTLAIDPHYTEKIIQQIIRIPRLDGTLTASFLGKCMDNLFQAYSVPFDMESQKVIEDYVSSQVTNIRQFKRLVNSVFSNVFCNVSNLNPYSLLAIDCIQFFEPDVYQSIFENPQYYIDNDTIYIKHPLSIPYRTEEYEAQCKAYFETFGKTISIDTCALISFLFPSANKYLPKTLQSYHEHSNFSQKFPLINSAKFFELYFTYSTNEFLELNKSIKNLIDSQNKEQNEISELFKDIMKSFSWSYQREWFMQLTTSKDWISNQSYVKIFYAILNSIELINDRRSFMQLSAKGYAISFLAELLLQFSKEDFSGFLSYIEGKYAYVSVIKQLIYWLVSLSKKYNNESEFIAQLTELHQGMCHEIIDKRINLFSDDYYHQDITKGLTNDDYNITEIDIRHYIADILTKDNIYRIMGELVSYMLGDTYMYYFSQEIIHRYFENESVIDECISLSPPKNESESFLYDLYDEYKNGEVQLDGKKGIWKKEYFQFEL